MNAKFVVPLRRKIRRRALGRKRPAVNQPPNPTLQHNKRRLLTLFATTPNLRKIHS